MHPRTPLAAALDTAVVISFIAIGRRNHDEDGEISGLVETAAPFLIALAIAWAIWRVWLQPDAVTTGVRVWLTTLGLGMVLRNLVFDDGTATSFVLIASIFLGTFIVGWRAVAGALAFRSTSRLR